MADMTSSDGVRKQEAFVTRTIEERNIRFVRLWFTDVLGFLKSVAISPPELENAFDEGIGFDGSAIEGFARITESDMVARPDASTFSVLPWRTEAPGAGRKWWLLALWATAATACVAPCGGTSGRTVCCGPVSSASPA